MKWYQSLALRNVFFAILQPGVVTGLVPYLLVRNDIQQIIQQPFIIHHYLGILIFLPGLVILIHCISKFATEGKGTLSPADPTKQLVIKGLYKYSRNPMYVGVMLLLIGEGVFIWTSSSLWTYVLSVFVAFNLFIVLREEPRLKRDFGSAYDIYRKSVRRWL
ncbi:MAG TPA: isoprenylcysteine carboxylmethyltransferase family protein [Ohtaekwangia sp.]